MSALSKFKESMVEGSVWKITFRDWCGPVSEKKIVTSVKSGYFIMEKFDDCERIGKEKKETYTDFPKAADFKINEEGEAEFYFQGTLKWKMKRLFTPAQVISNTRNYLGDLLWFLKDSRKELKRKLDTLGEQTTAENLSLLENLKCQLQKMENELGCTQNTLWVMEGE